MNYPSTFPEHINTDKLRDAYSRGWNHAHGIACHNVPTLGDKLLTDSMGRVTVNTDNIREIHESLCYEAEMNSRDYSPWEHTASWINEHGEGSDNEPGSYELWQAYDDGVTDSITADLSTYTDEDYGINEQD